MKSWQLRIELSARIADSLKAFAAQSKAYHAISEEAYYNAREK